MSDNYRYVNALKDIADVAVGASATETEVFGAKEITSEDSKNIRIALKCSAAVEVTGISWKLQHRWNSDEDWADVSPGGAVATVSIVSDAPADADVNSGTEEITMTSHGFQTGDAVYYYCDGAGVVTGLTSGTVYYVIDNGTNAVKLATTYANAIAGTAIDLTQPSGGDNHYFTAINSELVLNIENSTDEAVLPLRPQIRVVATTGTSDVFTVSDAFISRRIR